MAKNNTSDGYMPKGREGKRKESYEYLGNNRLALRAQEYKAKQTKKMDSHMKLLEEHLKEADRKGAEATNIGWASGPKFIHSKTTKGKLFTEEKKGSYSHSWDNEEN